MQYEILAEKEANHTSKIKKKHVYFGFQFNYVLRLFFKNSILLKKSERVTLLQINNRQQLNVNTPNAPHLVNKKGAKKDVYKYFLNAEQYITLKKWSRPAAAQFSRMKFGPSKKKKKIDEFWKIDEAIRLKDVVNAGKLGYIWIRWRTKCQF